MTDLAQKTDEQLVALSLQDQKHFLHLMQRYSAKLKKYVLRISNFDEDSVEDILQETFIKVYQNLNDFDKDLKFSSWIYRIAHNQLISEFRKRKARPQLVENDEDDSILNKLASEFKLEKEMDQQFLKNEMICALKQVDVKYQEVLVLRYFEDMDYKEISNILKKPVGTVGTMLNRAKQALKKEIEKIYDKRKLRTASAE